MTALLLGWLFLLVVAVVPGCILLRIFQGELAGARLLLAGVWVGVLVLADGALALSLFSPVMGQFGLYGLWISVVLLFASGARYNWTRLSSGMSRTGVLLGLLLAGAIALVFCQRPTLYDSGLYHAQLIQWMADAGVVPGLSLLHLRLGFASSWFALAAVFDHGLLQHRMIALLGGFAFGLGVFHFGLSIVRLRRENQVSDWFAAIAYLFILPFCVHRAMVPSTSPNLPIALLSVVICWLILVSAEASLGRRFSSLLTILAGCTVAVKLSAFPMLFGVLVLEIKHPRRLLQNMALAGVMILPFLGFGVITSSCPLFPIPWCLESLPWSVGTDYARGVTQLVKDWPRWSGDLERMTSGGFWFLHWVQAEPLTLIVLLVSLGSLLGFIYLKLFMKPGVMPVLSIACLGTFMFLSSPDLRYGVGYLAIAPALLLGHGLNTQDSQLRSRWRFLVLFLLVMLMMAPLPQQISLVLPAKMRTATRGFTWQQTQNVRYLQPVKGDRCWAVAIPCTPKLFRPDIRLRSPEQKLSGGFVRG